MNKGKKILSFFNKVSAVCMVLALAWLTVSTPFVFAAQQKLAEIEKTAHAAAGPGNEEESTNPFGNSTEEKAPTNTSLSEEYLHDSHAQHHFFGETLQHTGSGDAGTYIAFHGELLVPPPNAA